MAKELMGKYIAPVAPRRGSVNLNYNVDFGNPQVNVAPRRGSGNLN